LRAAAGLSLALCAGMRRNRPCNPLLPWDAEPTIFRNSRVTIPGPRDRKSQPRKTPFVPPAQIDLVTWLIDLPGRKNNSVDRKPLLPPAPRPKPRAASPTAAAADGTPRLSLRIQHTIETSS
jgi:hypothetical protein